jgi:hypothetical protein
VDGRIIGVEYGFRFRDRDASYRTSWLGQSAWLMIRVSTGVFTAGFGRSPAAFIRHDWRE